MLNLLLILLGLISNPSDSNNTYNCGSDGNGSAISTPTPQPNPNPVDTGGEDGHIPIKK